MKSPQSNSYTLNNYIIDYPLDERWNSIAKPVHYFFIIDVEKPLDEVWTGVSDTSRINEAAGLSRMYFTERDGKRYGRNRLLGFITQEWEEIPWEWHYGNDIIAERIYSRGIAEYVRFHLLLEPLSDRSTRLYMHFGWIPRNSIGRALLHVAQKRIEKRFTRAIHKLMEEEPEKAEVSLLPEKLSFATINIRQSSPVDHSRIENIKKRMLEEEIPADIVDRLINHILQAPDSDLYRIRPKKLGSFFNIDESTLLNVMLHATRKGLLNLSWDIVCPHCRGVRERVNHLWDVPKNSACEVCQIDFDTGSQNSIEITFHPNPEVREVEEILYCSAEPSKKPHIKFQKSLQPGEDHSFNFNMDPGRYRLRIQGRKTYNMLDIIQNMQPDNIYWNDVSENKFFESGPVPSVQIENNNSVTHAFIIEENQEDREVLRPRDIFNYQDFHDLFSEEALSAGLSIDVGIQNIVFADMVRSSELYKREGNSRAFSMVREFFRISHDIAKKHKGAIIKTMGDAVMLSFNQPIDALKASMDFIRKFDGSNSRAPFTTRVTLNRGPCLAVNLNSSIDYFGHPVNIAAKLQNYTGSGQVSITNDILDDTTVEEYLLARKFNIDNIKHADINGIGVIDYWRFTPKFKEPSTMDR